MSTNRLGRAAMAAVSTVTGGLSAVSPASQRHRRTGEDPQTAARLTTFSQSRNERYVVPEASRRLVNSRVSVARDVASTLGNPAETVENIPGALKQVMHELQVVRGIANEIVQRGITPERMSELAASAGIPVEVVERATAHAISITTGEAQVIGVGVILSQALVAGLRSTGHPAAKALALAIELTGPAAAAHQMVEGLERGVGVLPRPLQNVFAGTDGRLP